MLEDLPGCVDDAGDDVMTIPNINQLHKLLAMALATKESGLTPKEVRFLRTELGLTQAELAKVVGRDAQTVGRWERGEVAPVEAAVETLVRVLVFQHLQGTLPPLEELSARTLSASTPPIRVDASDPSHYRVLEAA